MQLAELEESPMGDRVAREFERTRDIERRADSLAESGAMIRNADEVRVS